jgi:hypothetical protein
MKKAHRVGRVIKITTFQPVKRGNWFLRLSCTNMGSIMLMAKSVSNPENIFVKFFTDEIMASSFVDFLVLQDTYTVDPHEDI